MKRALVALLAFALCLTAIAGACAEEERIVIGQVFWGLHDSYQHAHQVQTQKYLEELGIDYIPIDGQMKPEVQTAAMEDLIARGVDGIICQAYDQASMELSIQMAQDAGIPVVTLQRAVPGAKVTSHIGTDNVVIGREGAEWVAKALGGKGNLVVMEGIPGAASSEDRKKGSAEVWPKYPGIRIVAQQSGKYDRAVALGVMENILQAQPQIDAVFCFNDEMAMGALAAVKASKRTGIKITGMDANKDAREAVTRGELAMTIALPPYNIGKTGVLHARWIKTKEQPVPPRTVMAVEFITK